MTSITIYDGANTIGGNKIYLEEKERGIFLDFGMNFHAYDKFFQEFLKYRSNRGIYDLFHLDLIPKLNIYRKDIVPPDLNMMGYPKLNIEAILLSHAHMDHYGNIGFLRKDIPLVASKTTLALVKGIMDCSKFSSNIEVSLFKEREIDETNYTIKAKRGNYNFKSRNLICTEELSDSIKGFLLTDFGSAPNQDGIYHSIKCDKICDLSKNPTHFEIKAYPVDHSIYGATGYIISGERTIAYTGDFRLHGKQANKTKKFINNAKDASILIIEGTRAKRDDLKESENDVFKNCLKIIRHSKGLVVADFASRNLERMEIFNKIAQEVDRTLVVPSKQVYLLKTLEKIDSIKRTDNILVFDEKRTYEKQWEYAFLRDELEFIKPTEIAKASKEFILCFSLYDIKHLLDIKPQYGTYVYSSSEAFEEESEFDFIRLYNWLDYFGFDIHGFNLIQSHNQLKPAFTKGLHASGHASKNDLIEVIDKIEPDVIIPVHTDNPEWFKTTFSNTKLLNNGQKLIL
ncbi:MAG: MBL fold metallo-hydrolase [Candidatus Lokiarchaeota archaeon]|nr:MBL fold metallo-hydrolase [Candidatus Lokiarchaeota archaeon]MBD3338294.1 MBL fold metallo-hydrolase [Candidatus Lokiarchaeota archaeon]